MASFWSCSFVFSVSRMEYEPDLRPKKPERVFACCIVNPRFVPLLVLDINFLTKQYVYSSKGDPQNPKHSSFEVSSSSTNRRQRRYQYPHLPIERAVVGRRDHWHETAGDAYSSSAKLFLGEGVRVLWMVFINNKVLFSWLGFRKLPTGRNLFAESLHNTPELGGTNT